MALLQISEPGRSAQPHQKKLAIGIDLGTTNSLVASVISGKPQVLSDEQGTELFPSVVRYHENGSVSVGVAAKSAAQSDASNTIFSVKRLMGRGLEDVKTIGDQLPYDFVASDSGMPAISTVAGPKSPVEVSAEILKVLAAIGRQTLGGDITGAVITVPAYFDESQRQATKMAAKLAGLPVLRLLNEPTAAAVAYGLDQSSEGVHAIYDLGGGTFDISILRLNKGVFEVLATGGDSALGGDDFDHAIVDWIAEQIKDGSALKQLSHEDSRQLLDTAKQAKEYLTSHDSAQLSIELSNGLKWSGELNRAQFDASVQALVAKTIKVCKKALRDADITLEDIDELVLVGGSTRMPTVRHAVAQWLKKEPLVSIDPDKVVAVGAARQADILVGNKPDSDMLLLDVIPLSLGLETMGGLAEKVIPRNTTIPVAKRQEFTTFKDGQTAIAIHVVQGERELVRDCRSLARFTLSGIPPMTAGSAKIRVSFQVDADGLLSVSAEELTSGVQSKIEVVPSFGLADGDIAAMLQESFAHAEDDKDSRMLQEQITEAERMVEALTSALALDGKTLLNDDEYAQLQHCIDTLNSVQQQQDPDVVESAITVANEASLEFAGRRMNQGIQKALAGQRVDDLESTQSSSSDQSAE